MGTYFHGNSEIQGGGDGLQTLILMNPGYVGFSDTQSTGTNNFAFLNSIASGNAISISHAPPHSQSQQFVGIPLATAGSLPPTSSQEAHASGVHSQHDITALHGLIRSQYSMYAPSVDIAAAREVPRSQGLSLSLSSQHGNFRHEGGEAAAASQQMVTAAISPSSADDPVRLSGGSSSSASGISNGGSRILSSKYLKAAQELLDEVVNVGKGIKTGANSQAKSIPAGESSGVEAAGDGQTGVESSSGNRTTDLTTAERQEIQMKKAKLVNMLDEVEQRYRQYHNQMHLVISWFEQAAGNGSAKTYTAVALQTISKQFRCLKDAILGQVRAASKSLGEECVGMKMESSSRLKFVDNHLRQQRALQQLGMIQHNAWRPQRGLPEPSVSVLRAWLFEHFLHPYPKDSDKIMLAKQTGLTRSQVSNWFINARVRLWKPMVEEMYLEEIKEQEKSGGGEDKTNKDEGSASLQDKSPASENQDRNDNKMDNNPSATSMSMSNLVGSSEIDSITQGSPKKARGLSNVAPSITMDSTKPMKFDNDRQNREEFSLEGSTNFMAAFGMEQMGRFSTEDFPSPYSTNAVSLTLGLQHSENLSAMSATHHNFLPNQEMQMGRGVVIGEGNDFVGGMNTPTSSHPTNVFENFNIQNRKRFPPQLLPDFVT